MIYAYTVIFLDSAYGVIGPVPSSLLSDHTTHNVISVAYSLGLSWLRGVVELKSWANFCHGQDLNLPHSSKHLLPDQPCVDV